MVKVAALVPGLASRLAGAVPRIARAQAMDALSAQAFVTGHRAALVAAERLPKAAVVHAYDVRAAAAGEERARPQRELLAPPRHRGGRADHHRRGAGAVRAAAGDGGDGGRETCSATAVERRCPRWMESRC